MKQWLATKQPAFGFRTSGGTHACSGRSPISRPTPSDYSRRAARAEAKKLALGILANHLQEAVDADFDEVAVVSRADIARATAHWTADWQSGTRRELGRAVAELQAEFGRRAGFS
jgi:hypothetical protein